MPPGGHRFDQVAFYSIPPPFAILPAGEGFGVCDYLEKLGFDYGEYFPKRGRGVRVGVVDTGIQRDHPAFSSLHSSAIVAARDFTGRHPVTDVRDFSGHGTHVAGVIGSSREGRSGVAPACELVIARVFPSEGVATVDMIAEGILWCVEQGCRVVNLSLSVSGDAKAIRDACEVAEAAGVFVVAAVGNFGYRHEVQWPAAYPTVMGVGSVDSDGVPSKFSAAGPECDVVAPGEKVISSYLNNTFNALDGTSMATPFVAGAAALILAERPETSPVELRVALQAGAVDIYDPGRDERTGSGWLNASNALLSLQGSSKIYGAHRTEVEALGALVSARVFTQSCTYPKALQMLLTDLLAWVIKRYARSNGSLRTPMLARVKVGPVVRLWSYVKALVAYGRTV